MLGRFVRRYPGRSGGALGAVFLASLLEGAGMAMLLSMLSMATDESGEPTAPQRVAMAALENIGINPTTTNLLLAAIVLIGLRAVMSLVANRQVGYTVAHIATDLRLTLIRSTMRARWQHYLDQSVGGLSNSVATEAQRASETFQLGAEMAAMALTSVVYLVVAFSISVEAGIGAAVAGGLLVGTLRILIRKSRKAGVRQTELQKSLLTLINAQFTAAKPLKAMAREDHVDALLTGETQLLERALRKQVISKGALTAFQEPMLAILVGIGFYVGRTVLDIPMAELVVMLFMLARVVNYVAKGQKAYQQLVIHESAYWSAMAAIDAANAAQEPPGGGKPAHLTSEIKLDDVVFSHAGGHRIFNGISLRIPARGLTLIIGPSGSGKTTLLDLIAGLRQPQGGQVLIDGVPLPELDLRGWRRQIGYVPQESVLVDESVAHNLTLGEDVPEEKIRAALREADALAFVEAMPEGLATRVGQNGSRLSGGQRQRLAIARALIHDPKLLILDEATSNLDPEAQQAIVETVARLKTHMAVLGVAHTQKLVHAADHVWRLAEGRLVPLTLEEGRASLGG